MPKEPLRPSIGDYPFVATCHFTFPPPRILRKQPPLTLTPTQEDEHHIFDAATRISQPCVQQTVSFIDLSAELHNRVYELALPRKGIDDPLVVCGPRVDKLMVLATHHARVSTTS